MFSKLLSIFRQKFQKADNLDGILEIQTFLSSNLSNLLNQAQKSDNPKAAIELQRLMSDYSERCNCAGWIINTEDDLWYMIHKRETMWGQDEISLEESDYLKKLAKTCNGWWIYENYLTFIILEDWKIFYQERNQWIREEFRLKESDY